MPTLFKNKKIHLDYKVLEEIEGGIVLHGFEVRSLKLKQGSIVGARVVVRGDEAFVLSMHIPPYQVKNTPKDYDPKRTRKLLLKNKEIRYIAGKEKEKGLTILPISVYIKGRTIKVMIGILRGLKKYDKREVIKRKESDRKNRRILRS